MRAFIAGCAGHSLSRDEQTFFEEAKPWGFILFRRNIDSPDQVRRLIDSLRRSVDRLDAPVLIDQEGGRVQRLGPPHWPAYPKARFFGDLHRRKPMRARELCRMSAMLMAHDLRALGINVDCVPVLDLPIAGSHDVIGDRAYGDTIEVVATLGRASSEGLLAGGIMPVIKHIPGHGRAMVDSHLALPTVETGREELAASDFQPFMHLSDMPAAMSAHVVYSAIDKRNPATTSKRMIKKIIRRDIGFDGLLMSDDLSMKALGGSFNSRTESCFKAGIDVVLHCNGDLKEMQEVADATPKLSGKAKARAKAALARISHTPEPFDVKYARAELAKAMLEGLKSGSQ